SASTKARRRPKRRAASLTTPGRNGPAVVGSVPDTASNANRSATATKPSASSVGSGVAVGHGVGAESDQIGLGLWVVLEVILGRRGAQPVHERVVRLADLVGHDVVQFTERGTDLVEGL